jgi:hypothetical protein
MTTASFVRRTARPIRHEAAIYRFGVGQAVRMRGRFGNVSKDAENLSHHPETPGQWRFTAIPYSWQRRAYERVTTEDSLEPVELPSVDTSAAFVEKRLAAGLRDALDIASAIADPQPAATPRCDVDSR